MNRLQVTSPPAEPVTGTDIGHPGSRCGTRPEERQPSFAINGRFFGQRTTGVQRYAREITGALDAVLTQTNRRARVVVPVAASRSVPVFEALQTTSAAPLGGHLWEQIVLPARSRLPLLNLCNTAPAVRRRQVVCMHDANVFLQPDSYSAAFRSSYRALLPWLARRAARVSTVSRASASHLAAHLPIRLSDIDVIPNGADHVRRWNAAASGLAARFEGRRPFVLLLGSRARHKNAALVLRQAEALDALGLDLVVVGGQAGIFAATATPAGPNVMELGIASDDDLAFLYARALCLAFPSFTEGFGLPIIEAMALGCPVVSSDRDAMAEICGGAALLASPDDPAAWQVHFAALAGSAALQGELGARGREQAARFSWAASARHYLELIGDVA